MTATLSSPLTPYRKTAIPCAVRREVCRRAGGVPLTTTPTGCTYCQRPGLIYWPTPGWVTLGGGLEFGHVIPERHGGAHTADNIRIECRPCNRGRGAIPAPEVSL